MSVSLRGLLPFGVIQIFSFLRLIIKIMIIMACLLLCFSISWTCFSLYRPVLFLVLCIFWICFSSLYSYLVGLNVAITCINASPCNYLIFKGKAFVFIPVVVYWINIAISLQVGNSSSRNDSKVCPFVFDDSWTSMGVFVYTICTLQLKN